MSTSLDDALSGVSEEAVPEAVAEPVEAPETVEPEATAEPEVPETPEPEVAPEPKPEPATVPLAAVQEERQKRQELERQIAAMRQQKPPEPTPDVFEQPDQVIPYMKKQMDEALMAQRSEMSRMFAEQQFGADEVAAAQEAILKPGMEADANRLSAEPMPYVALVKWHQQQKLMSEIGDNPNAWRDAERAKIRAEVEAEQAVKAARAAPSLATQTSVGERSGPAWAGPTPLGDILKD
jgi:hypothetical protein